MGRGPQPTAAAEPQIETGNTLSPVPDFQAMGDSLGARLTEWLKLRTDQIEQKVDLTMKGLEREVIAKLDSKPGHGALIGHTVTTVGLILATLFAVMSIAGDRFNSGASVTGIMASQTVERERRDAEINRQLSQITNDLRAIKQEQTAKR